MHINKNKFIPLLSEVDSRELDIFLFMLLSFGFIEVKVCVVPIPEWGRDGLFGEISIMQA